MLSYETNVTELALLGAYNCKVTGVLELCMCGRGWARFEAKVDLYKVTLYEAIAIG